MGRGGARMGKDFKGRNQATNATTAEENKERVAAAQQARDAKAELAVKQMEEYERKAKLAEAQRVKLKALLEQEMHNTRLNKKILTDLHRQLLRDQKTAELADEIAVIAQTHERYVDRNDAIVQMIMNDIDQAEQSILKIQRNHMSKLDKFVTLNESVSAQLEQEFERDVKTLQEEFDSEKRAIVQQQQINVEEMTGVIQAVEEAERKRVEDSKQTHETEREEIRNKNLEDINMLRISLENRIEDLEKQFDDAHQHYVEHTDQANRQFKKLQKKDQTLNKQIQAKKRKSERFQQKLAACKKAIVASEKECIGRNKALRVQKEIIAKHCQELKARMKRFRANESRKLTELTVLSRKALRKNEERAKLAEKILKLAELARKYETEREKVLPFEVQAVEALAKDQAKDTQDDRKHSSALPGEDGSEDSSDVNADIVKSVGKYEKLDNFHARYNKVLLDQLAIEQEKNRLAAENEELRGILKQYLDGITVTETVVDKANPLLIVNGRVNLLPAAGQVQRARQPPQLEASQVVDNYRMQGIRV